MKITERKPAAKNDDFLTSVARSIGSTLGAVAAKVNSSTRTTRRRIVRKRARKPPSVSRAIRRRSAPVSRKNSKAVRVSRRNRKKSSR